MLINIELQLRKHLPTIFDFFGESTLKTAQWQKINDNFFKNQEERKRRYKANDNYLVVERSIYDVIRAAEAGDLKASMLLSFIKKVFEELSTSIPPLERLKLKKTIFNLLISFDAKYFNYLGELLVLNNILKNEEYRLGGVEIKITKNKTADFLIIKNDNSHSSLVEVVNIHLGERTTNIDKYIEGKLISKVENKTYNNQDYEPFILIPVIWAPYETLKKVEQLYNEGAIRKTKMIWEATAFAMFTYPENHVLYRFGYVTTLLNFNRV